MNKLFLLFGLAIAGCGEYNPCGPDYDVFHENVCIRTNGFPVNLDEFSYVLSVTELAYNGYYIDNPVDIRQLLEDNPIYVSYDFGIAPRVYGAMVWDHDNVKTPDVVEDDFMLLLGYNCWLRNYVLGHEMLHVIGEFHQKVSREDNHNHMIPNVFLRWATATNTAKGATAEYAIGSALRPYCLEQQTGKYY